MKKIDFAAEKRIKMASHQLEVVLELKDIIEEKLELRKTSSKSENPENPGPQVLLPPQADQPSAHHFALPKRFHQKDFALRRD